MSSTKSTRVEVPTERLGLSPRGWGVLGLLVGTLLLSVVAIGIAVGGRKTVSTAAPAPTYKAQASLVLHAWLDGKPPPVPVATGIAADLGRSLSTAAQESGSPPPIAPITVTDVAYAGSTPHVLGKRKWVVDTFDVSTTTTTWVASVTLLVTPSGPVVGTLPSLAPYTHATGAPGQLTYANIYTKYQTTLTQGESSQVDAWAAAFVSNNRSQLYTLSGDTSDVHFDGLTGFKAAGIPSVLSATKGTNSVLVALTLPVEPKGYSNQRLSLGYDVLLENTGNPLPNIVAWGPAGTGFSLYPYENARKGVVVP